MTRGRFDRVVVAVSLLALAPSGARAQVSDGYLRLLERYARGNRPEAIAGLSAFGERDFNAFHAWGVAASRCGNCKTAEEFLRLPLRAAVMLHADRDSEDRPEPWGNEQRRPCPGRHGSVAGRYAALLARWPETKDFARRFFLSMALRCQWDSCFDHGLRWARDGLKLFPSDALLQLAAGSIIEENATLSLVRSTEGTAGLRQRQRDEVRNAVANRASQFREARRYFEESLSSDPELAMARVRLGRVLWQLGEAEAARVALEQASERTLDPALLYLARLFLGRVHEDVGRLDQAALEYRLALALDPKAQAAAVALSHVLRKGGDAEGSRKVLSQTLAHAGRRPAQDAFWNYLMRNALHVDELFEALRRETLQ